MLNNRSQHLPKLKKEDKFWATENRQVEHEQYLTGEL